MTRAPAQILAIDLVRFACAMMVVAHHFAAMLPIDPPRFATGLVLPRDWTAWSWSGWVGVELFFVVSGYVIAVSASGGTRADFARRRVLRLVPAAWICATITSLVALAAAIDAPHALLARWAASLVFWPWAQQADPSYWTLGIEFAFYALVAAAATARPARLDVVGTLLAAISLAFWVARGGWDAGESLSRTIDLTLAPHGAFFAVGIALWRIRDTGWSPLRLVTLLVGLTAGVFEIGAHARYMAAGLHLDATPAQPLAIFAIGIVVIACATRLQAPLARWLGARRLALAGLVTYPLYLIHQQTGALLIVALRRLGVPGHVAIVVTAATALLAATAITLHLEPPLRRWLARRIDAFSPPRALPQDTLPSASLPAG